VRQFLYIAQEMCIDSSSWRRHISYLSNSYGISLLLDDCDDRVICHRQIQMHFFSCERERTECRSVPPEVVWSRWLARDLYGGARVYRCLHAVITPRESIVATGEYINTGTFSIAPP